MWAAAVENERQENERQENERQERRCTCRAITWTLNPTVNRTWRGSPVRFLAHLYTISLVRAMTALPVGTTCAGREITVYWQKQQ